MPVPSPDGTQDWLVYHAKIKATDGWDDREIRAQPFTWNADNTPQFGDPIADSAALAVPSGEPCGLVSEWPLDDSLTDDQQRTATAHGSPTWISETGGPSGHSLHFNGVSDYLDLNASLLNTMGSYTVSAWVRLDRADPGTATTMAIASQEGGISSAFALEYSAGKFAFTMYDGLGAMTQQVVSTVKPVAGTWYHVIGVRDALNRQIILYVDGKAEGAAPYNGDWSSRGHTIIGAARQHTQRVHYFAGALAGLRFYDAALSSAEVVSTR